MTNVVEIKLTEEQRQQLNQPSMTLEQFLSQLGVSESDLSEISIEDALAAVQEDGYALRYVADSNQTAEVCLAAVQRNGDALQYVKRAAFEAAKIVLVEGVKYALNKVA